jgi:hypothetical protein
MKICIKQSPERIREAIEKTLLTPMVEQMAKMKDGDVLTIEASCVETLSSNLFGDFVDVKMNKSFRVSLPIQLVPPNER